MKASELFELIDDASRGHVNMTIQVNIHPEAQLLRAAAAALDYAREHREELLRLDLEQAAREYVARIWHRDTPPPTQVVFISGGIAPCAVRDGDWLIFAGRDWRPE